MEEIMENMSVQRVSLAQSIDQTTALNNHVEPIIYLHDLVKIVPSKMVFTDAYDGKHFKRSFTIINCGKRPAFVRIFPPTSQAFKTKPLKKGRYLPSGLSVTRTIQYTHSSAMALNKACLFVYINEEQFTYQIEVHLISAYVTLHPKVLNFGEIDVGNASEQLSIQLRNVGHRLAQFSIDLGRNDLELIVDPMKGTIMPDGVVQVKVEVLGSQIGSFDKEFWVKTEPPRRVKIGGIFIAPRVVIEYPISRFNFTLVDFPKTYYGAESVKTIVITNTSSTDRMFCMVSERGKEVDYLRKAKRLNDNLKCFSFNCVEGRLLRRQNYILKFTFTPLKLENFFRNYCQAFVRVAEVNYRDGIVAEREEVVKTFTSAASVEEFLASPIDNLQEFDDIQLPESSFIRICLHGEMEEPSVKLLPEDFTLSYLEIDETYNRIVNIRNCSQYLPITLRSNIVPCVKVKPREVYLGPAESLEITLMITPSGEGTRNYKIIFQLIHRALQKEYKVGTVTLPLTFSASKTYPKKEPKFNMGITPEITHEVGFLVDDVRFNSKIAKPRQAIVDEKHESFNKKNTDLIAFPNDMPKCLRPWKSTVPCRTIFSKLPRIISDQDEYTLTPQELANKERNDKFYLNYINKNAARRQRWRRKITTACNEDYDVTDKNHLLVENLHLNTDLSHPRSHRYGCIPLPPERLMEVIIKPKYVYLGKIAPYTTCTDSFSIQNRNSFSIHVSIKALSNSVVIKEKSRIVIGPKKTRNIFFDCFSHGYGKFYVPVYIIINDSHIFDGTVFASVVPTTVKCDQKEIIINPKTHRSFFELFNPVNCEIRFSWEIQDKNFKVVPDSGVVPPRKNVYCSVMFLPQINATYKTEIYLLSQSGAKQIITVICKNERATIGFSTDEVEFNNIPLNVTMVKHIVLRNFSDEEIMYLVENPNPLDEITISPTVGKINAKSDIDFSIIVLFKDVISFNCPVTFILQDDYSYVINVKGNVVFPTINLTPQNLQIPKVPLGCCIRNTFKVRNTSQANNLIAFHLDDIPEFTVKDLESKPITDAFTLKPDEMKEMVLEFQPMEPLAYSLYFPYCLNDMIGPPVLNEPRTLRPEYYFQKQGEICIKRSSDLPKTIRTFTIRCAASAFWFTFSSLNMVFNHDNKAKCRKRFTITNISKVDRTFTIPHINPKHPFTVKFEKKIEHQTVDNSWKFVIKPDEVVALKVEYIPLQHGSSTVELPIYVEEFPLKRPFNYLKLTGVYHSPVISCKKNLLCFQAITIKEKVNKKITLLMDSHQRGCDVDVEISHETLSVKQLRRIDSSKSTDNVYNSVAEYLIRFSPSRECIVHSPIVFKCSCGVSFEIFVRASADNCIFSSYQSFIKTRAAIEGEKFESTFPFFPVVENNSYYARTVKVIKEDVERWLFSQGFFYMGFYKIPYGLARFPVDIHPKIEKVPMKSSEKPQMVLTLVQLLVNLIDPNVTKYFYEGTPEPCFKGIEGVIYAYSVYKNIIKFLEVQRVFVAQLKPEHLLPYDKYMIYKESLAGDDPSMRKIFSADDFLYFTKQVWLDLILRIYRVFVYNRVMNSFVSQKLRISNAPLVYDVELGEYYSEHQTDFGDGVNERETKLMMWLEFHFEKQRWVLWDEHTNSHLKKRKIRSFEKDLADSLPFATLMVAYCPYMRKCFDNFFPLYQNEEDMYHNACIIYETWKRLGLSYDLQPIRIVKSSATEMEILITYLYDVLPNFYPTEVITFNTSLGEVATNKIVLRNKGDAVIAYTALFFLNDTEAFAVNEEVITIAPGGINNLKVCYKAKSILKKKAVLILSGETIGYKFAKTLAFNLVGTPNIFQFTDEFTYDVEVFKKVNRTLEVNSPFETSYVAKLYFYFGDQTKAPENLDEFVSVSSMAAQKLPRQVCINSECKFDSNGEADVKLRMCYVACGDYTYFLYFSNREVGDFCVKINVKATFPGKRSVDLPVNLPNEFFNRKCTCSPRAIDVKCPCVILIDLPCKNQQLIDGLRMMFQNCADEDEFFFWKPLLDYPKGFHVLKEYLDNTFDEVLVPYKKILEPQVTYNVRTKLGKKVTIAKSVSIPNVTSSLTQRLEMHWNATQTPEKEMLVLIADHEREVRKFALRFVNTERLNYK